MAKKKYGYLATIGADTSGLNAALDESDKALRKTNSELQEINKGLKLDPGNVELLSQKYTVLSEKLEATRTRMEALEKSQADAAKSLSDEEYRQYIRELESTKANAAALEKEVKALSGGIDKSSQAFRKAVESTKEYQQAMDKLGASSDKLKKELNDIWNFTLKAAGAITTAAVGASAAATKIGMDFDASMSNVKALSGAAGEELDALREKAKEMGATTSRTAKESADALGYMALAGWDTQQMLEGLEPILRASEAGSMDLATASDLITDSMSSMGIAVSDLTHYLDVATKAQSSSNTSLEQLLNAYVVAGGTFKNFNVSLEESATLLGVLANRGIKGSEAGNALNSILINLIGASGKSSEAMKTLGVSAFDTDGKFIGVTETLEQVAAALAKLDDEQKAVLTAQLGGKTQYDTLQALLSGVSDEYDTLLGKIEDSNGALEKTAQIMRDNLQGDVTTLKSALEDLGIEVNEQFTEDFREAVQVTTREISRLSDAVSDEELGESLKKIAEAFAKVIEQIAKFVVNKSIPATINFFEFIAEHGELVKSLIVGIGSAFAAWKIVKTVSAATEVISDFKEATESGAKASEALEKTLKVDPWLALEAAIGVVVIALASYAAAKLDAAGEQLLLNTQLEETTQAIYDQTNAFNKSVAAAEINAKNAEKNAAAAHKYWYEITKLVDEQGNARGSANELNIAVAEFNKVAGTNISVIDGQIQGYKDLSSTMHDYIDDIQRQAKLSYLSDSYGEALVNIDETTKRYEEALKKREELNKDYLQKLKWFNEAQATGYSEYMPWEQLIEEKEAAEEAFSAAATEAAALEQAVMSYQSAIDKYNDILNETKKEEDNNGARIAAEGMAAQYREKYQKAAEEIEQDQEDLLQKLQSEMDELDYKKNIHGFADDTAYWSKRRQVLNKYLLKESEEWWKYYDEIEEYFNSLTEAEKKAYEQQISDQADALKERKELNDDFTDEMYYDELESLISTLDKESDLYKKYNSEILKGRKKLSDERKSQAEKDAKAEQDALKDAAQKQADELAKQKEQIKKQLQGFNLTEMVKTKDSEEKLILTDLNEEIKKLERYNASVAKLKATGISESLMSEINNMSYADGSRQRYIDELLKLPADKLKLYYDDWNRLQEEQEKVAQNAAEEQLKQSNKEAEEAIDSTEKMLDKVTQSAYEKGAQTGQNFFNGIIDGIEMGDNALIDKVFNSEYGSGSNDSVSAIEKTASKAGTASINNPKFISVDTPIAIYIDGEKKIETTVQKIIDKGIRSNSNVFKL